MSFRLSLDLNVEYRGLQSGISKRTGNPWVTLIFEDSSASQLQVNVPAHMQEDVRCLGLTKGDYCAISIVACAFADGNSYITLQELPKLIDDDGTVVDF